MTPLNRPSAFAKATADKLGTFSPTGGEGRDEGVRFMERWSDRVPGRTGANPTTPIFHLSLPEQSRSHYLVKQRRP